MALYVTRPRRDEERIGRGLPSELHLCDEERIGRGLPSDIFGFYYYGRF